MSSRGHWAVSRDTWLPQLRKRLACSGMGASVEHLQGPEHPLKITQDRVRSAPGLIIWEAESPSFGSCCRCDTSNLRDGGALLWPQF